MKPTTPATSPRSRTVAGAPVPGSTCWSSPRTRLITWRSHSACSARSLCLWPSASPQEVARLPTSPGP
ncbi:PVR cell adhesion molecule [Rhinolophus ferrumequinum]|uniref:PVR cell adhesion molecule n=1 Tax=Rhinolophus ferrumequinum TaxID=59479 RepID=A0A7J7SKF5_RHIFE|nr:PVR cell adhesion molecule [Rhinolophus ferrumequinum]